MSARRLLALAFVGILVGCRDSPQQLLETAELEEVQHNVAHAREIYQRIVRDYPDGPEAVKAAARLRATDGAPGA